MVNIGIIVEKSSALGDTTPVYGTIVPMKFQTMSANTAVLSSFPATINTARTVAFSFLSDSGVPGVLNWNSGDFIWECTIFGGNTSCVMNEVAFRRLSSDGHTIIASASSVYGTAYTLGAGAFKTATVTWSPFSSLNPSNALSTDRLEMIFCFTNRAGSIRTTIMCNGANSEVNTPIQSGITIPTYTFVDTNRSNISSSKSFLHTIISIQAISEFISNLSKFVINDYVNFTNTFKNNLTINRYTVIKILNKVMTNVSRTRVVLFTNKAYTNITKTNIHNIKTYTIASYKILHNNRFTLYMTKRLIHLVKTQVNSIRNFIDNNKSNVIKSISNIFTTHAIVIINKVLSEIYSVNVYVNNTKRLIDNIRVSAIRNIGLLNTNLASVISKLISKFSILSPLFQFQSIDVTPFSILKVTSDNVTISCNWIDPSDLDIGNYTCNIWVKDSRNIEHGPFSSNITKTSSMHYTGSYSIDPDESYDITNYSIKAVVSKRT
jgi:hypothetical protein